MAIRASFPFKGLSADPALPRKPHVLMPKPLMGKTHLMELNVICCINLNRGLSNLFFSFRTEHLLGVCSDSETERLGRGDGQSRGVSTPGWGGAGTPGTGLLFLCPCWPPRQFPGPPLEVSR